MDHRNKINEYFKQKNMDCRFELYNEVKKSELNNC